jgi:hypothetical protein
MDVRSLVQFGYQRGFGGTNYIAVQPWIFSKINLSGKLLMPRSADFEMDVGGTMRLQPEKVKDMAGVRMLWNVIGRRHDGGEGEASLGVGMDATTQVPLR